MDGSEVAGEARSEVQTQKILSYSAQISNRGLQILVIGCSYTYMEDFTHQLARSRHCTCAALRRASRAVSAHYESHFRGAEIRGTQFTVLSILAQAGPLSMTALSNHLGVERTTLTRNIALLVKRGLIAHTGTRDARVRLVEITRAGNRTLHTVLPRWVAAQDSVHTVLAGLKLPKELS